MRFSACPAKPDQQFYSGTRTPDLTYRRPDKQVLKSGRSWHLHSGQYHLGYTEDMVELRKREKEMGIEPDWELDAYMKAQTLEGKRQSIQTEYILNILGLDVSLFHHLSDSLQQAVVPTSVSS